MTRWPLLLIRLMAGVAGGLMASAAGWAQTSPPIEQNQQELARVRTRIQALQSRMDQDRGSKDAMQQQVQNAEQGIAAAQRQLTQLDRKVAARQAQVRDSQESMLRSLDLLQAQRQALARQMRAAYLIGDRAEIKLLLSQDRTQALGRVLTYYDYLNRARGRRIDGIQAQLDLLHAVQQRIRTQLDELTALKTEQLQALALLQSRKSERAGAAQQLARRIADAAEELQQLRANEKQTQALLQSLQDVLADIPLELGEAKPFAQLKGKLPWPARGALLAAFGAPKVSAVGSKLAWNGLWLAADAGAPVHAVGRGRIAYVGWLHRYGLIVIVEHDGGYFSLYGHADKVTRGEGEWVNPGDVIALAGNTGGYDRDGVYFELRKGTEPVDPGEWLEK